MTTRPSQLLVDSGRPGRTALPAPQPQLWVDGQGARKEQTFGERLQKDHQPNKPLGGRLRGTDSGGAGENAERLLPGDKRGICHPRTKAPEGTAGKNQRPRRLYGAQNRKPQGKAGWRSCKQLQEKKRRGNAGGSGQEVEYLNESHAVKGPSGRNGEKAWDPQQPHGLLLRPVCFLIVGWKLAGASQI